MVSKIDPLRNESILNSVKQPHGTRRLLAGATLPSVRPSITFRIAPTRRRANAQISALDEYTILRAGTVKMNASYEVRKESHSEKVLI